MRNIFCVLLLFAMTGCASTGKKPKLTQSTNEKCEASFEKAPLSNVLKTLNLVSELYDEGCYFEVIALGDYVRAHSRDKFYHVINESLEFVTPSGTFTEYTLESYERSYLSFLIAASYQKLSMNEKSEVELRKAYLEGQAYLYNYGEDPINLVLQAALWENSKSQLDSRPLWKRVAELSEDDLILQSFAEQRIKEIDSGIKKSSGWKIYAVGKFPELDWRADLFHSRGSYFSVHPKSNFQTTCRSEESLLVPTEAWAKKISRKYDREYHPLLNLQTWTRAPIGITVGAVTAVTGASIAVAGCGLEGYFTRGHSSGNLCKASMRAGVAVMGESGTVTGYVLRPDLRFWRRIPEAFYLTQTGNMEKDSCRPQWSNYREVLVFNQSLNKDTNEDSVH